MMPRTICVTGLAAVLCLASPGCLTSASDDACEDCAGSDSNGEDAASSGPGAGDGKSPGQQDDDAATRDAAAGSASAGNASVTDASVADASVADASVVDASVVDASVADASVADAAPPRDANAGPLACAGDRYNAASRPLDIYMMVDDSGSMVPYWPQTLDAIHLFLTDPQSAGIGVGIQFFGSECSADLYAVPRVPIAALPDNAPAIEASFPQLPIDGTATLPAVQGALQYARARANAFPDRTVAVLLVTDGLPNDCSSTVENVTDAIAAGLQATPSIKTFVVGLDTGLDALNGFAAAGGTGQAHLVEPGVASALLDAMRSVRASAVTMCDFGLPDLGGAGIDAGRVNLEYTDGLGAKWTIGWVPGQADCDATRGGWYFGAQGRVVACEASCNTLLDDARDVSIVLGCARVALEL